MILQQYAGWIIGLIAYRKNLDQLFTEDLHTSITESHHAEQQHLRCISTLEGKALKWHNNVVNQQNTANNAREFKEQLKQPCQCPRVNS